MEVTTTVLMDLSQEFRKGSLTETAMTNCFGFVWPGFGGSGAPGAASERSYQKLPPCPMEPLPARSKTDASLTTAEPISNSGCNSGIMCLRRRKSCHTRTIAAGERHENT